MSTDIAGWGARVPARTAGGALLVVAAVLASGAPAALVEARPIRIAVGVAITLALSGAAAVAGRTVLPGSLRDGLLALGVLSVFGWASAALSGVPAVAAWLDGAPVPVAFLVVNSMKLTSVVPLLVLAHLRGWSPRRMLVRVGDPLAPAFRYVRWPVLAVPVMLAVAALFVTELPATALDHLGVLPAWLPVMLAGSLVNAVAEELLYRHALIGTLRETIGVLPAVALSSVVFGLAHVTGTPGGLVGVLATGVYGAVCAAAMLQTRGMVWNTAIHVAGDVAAVGTLLLATQLG